MANQKLSALTTIPAIDRAVDLLYIVDVSGGTSNKTTINQMLGITGVPIGDTDTATMSNKTLTAPVISSPVLSGTVTGTYTFGGTPTFPSAVVTLTGSQTLTNKILTSPTINTATIVNPTLTVDAVTGFSVSNTGTVYGVSISAGVINSSALLNSVGTAAIQTNAVQASQLATNAITLGYQQITTTFTTASNISPQQVTGLTSTVTIPSGGRKIKITCFVEDISTNTGGSTVMLSIWDGTVGSGTQLASARQTNITAGQLNAISVQAVVTPAAGSKTYNISLQTDNAANTAFIEASATSPAFILVEAI